MKKTLFIAFLFPLIVSANILDIKNLNFYYSNPSGNITLEKFELIQDKWDWKLGPEELSLKVRPGGVDFKFGNFQITKKSPFTHFEKVKEYQIHKLNAAIGSSKSELSFNRFLQRYKDSRIQIDEFSLGCTSTTEKFFSTHKLLKHCIKEALLQVSFLSFTKEGKKSSRNFSLEEITNLEIKTYYGLLQIIGWSKVSGIPTKFKVRADISFDSETEIITIYIKSATANSLNVKKLLFDELEDHENERLQVERPYIYFQI